MKKKNVLYDMFLHLKPKSSLLIILFFISVVFVSSKLVCAIIFKKLLSSFGVVDVKLVVISMFLIIASGISYYFFITIRRFLKQKTLHKLQSMKIDTIKNFNLLDWEKEETGKWMTLLTGDAESLSDFIPHVCMPMLIGALQFTVAVAYGFYNSILFTVVIITLTFLSAILPAKIMPIIEQRRNEKQEDDAVIKGFLLDVINKIIVIKSYRAYTQFEKLFIKSYDKYASSTIKNTKINYQLTALNSGIGFLANAIWMSVGFYLIAIDKLSVGVFVGFITLSPYFNFPFFELGYTLAEIANIKASFKRYYLDHNNTPLIDKGNKDLSDIQVVDRQFNDILLECKNISFSYSQEANNVLNQVNFELLDGDRLLIDGASGTGKTTLLKVIAGLYAPSSGEISFKIGEDYIEPCKISQYMSYIPQGDSLFTASIRDNLLDGNPSASNEEIDRALRLSCSYDFVNALRNGIDTIIGSGSEIQLSVGQAQRIAIARGLLRNARIYLMDEITSALDPETEKLILQNIIESGITLIMISHKQLSKDICTKKMGFLSSSVSENF